MSRWRQILRRGQALLFVILALVPLALSGHYHLTPHESTPNSCVLCVVAHHAPAAQSPVLGDFAALLQLGSTPARRVVPPTQVFRPFTAGRAPPHYLRFA
jgi:hypothetical protein